MDLKRTRPKKRPRNLHGSLIILGLDPCLIFCKEIKRCPKCGKPAESTDRKKGTIYERLGERLILELAKIGHKEMISKYHPDRHKGNGFYEEYAKSINTAYDTVKRIIKGRLEPKNIIPRRKRK